MIIDLSGKMALVTGSTVGIGRAIAKGLAQSGASVVVNGRTAAKVETAVMALRSEIPGATIRGLAADVATPDGCAALVRAVSQVDILVNNAGIFEPKPFRSPTPTGRASLRSTSCRVCAFRALTFLAF
jgi:NAD(P)-dependent dehydrogenase (short-subunit alcohol dehydrogenase family)